MEKEREEVEVEVVVEEEEEEEEEEGGGGLEARKRARGKAGVGVDGEDGVGEEEIRVETGKRRSVYFDQDQGVWKCRHCTWTYRLCGPHIDHTLNHEEYCQVVMDVKNLLQPGSKFYSQPKGTIFADGMATMDLKNIDQLVAENGIRNGKIDLSTTKANGQGDLYVEYERRSTKVKVHDISNSQTYTETIENGATRAKAESEVEMDLERVLEEQDTHDLYCPNCNSCITKRVILRKRKRTAWNVKYVAKREKLQEVEVDHGSSLPETTDRDRDPEFFRCLSCFSLFFPTDGGFNIFRDFGKREQSTNLQSQEEIPTKTISWSSFIVSLTRNRKRDETSAPLLGESSNNFSKETENHPLNETNNIQSSSLSGAKMLGECQKATEGFTYFVGSSHGELLLSPGKQIKDPAGKVIHDESLIGVVNGNQNLSAVLNQFIDGRETILPVTDGVEKLVKQIAAPTTTSQQDYNIDIPPSHAAAYTPLLGTDVQRSAVGRTSDFDVLKSIVYGGLIESITSLGVVSSAAGAGSKTMNVIALGLANLIGGWFIITHDLWELKSGQREANDQEAEQGDRYWELLGRRTRFRLHATVALLSYTIFGLLPPVIYGYSFWKSDDMEYKLLAVAAASLLCIALLALGKAHVKLHRTYMKTLSYYIVLGVTASGLSYVAGRLINRFLEGLGWFNPSADAPPSPSIDFLMKSSNVPVWSS